MGISFSSWNVFNSTNQLKKSYIKNCWDKEPALSLQLTHYFKSSEVKASGSK